MSSPMSPTMTQPATPSAPRIDTPEAAERLCSRIAEAVSELVGLLDRETGLLRAGKPQDIVALHARKAALGNTLALDMDALRQDAEFVRMAVPGQIEALRAQQAAFERSLLANQEALAAMKAVSEALLRTIAGKAAERRAGPETYGKDAAIGVAPPLRPAAISVDRTL
jgi:hypothetical protein